MLDELDPCAMLPEFVNTPRPWSESHAHPTCVRSEPRTPTPASTARIRPDYLMQDPTRVDMLTTEDEWKEVGRQRPAATISAARDYLQTMGRAPRNAVLLTGLASVDDIVDQAIRSALKRRIGKQHQTLTPVVERASNARDVRRAAEAAGPSRPIHLAHADNLIRVPAAVAEIDEAIRSGHFLIVSTREDMTELQGRASKAGLTALQDMRRALQAFRLRRQRRARLAILLSRGGVRPAL